MCGIVGVSTISSAEDRLFEKLMACGNNVSHRGEQAWGILTFDGKKMNCHKQEGRFGEGITDAGARSLSKKMRGSKGLAQVLYSTIGSGGQKKQQKSLQPWVADFHGKPFGFAYNGNTYNLSPLREKARKAGWKFQSQHSDTEVIVALISTSKETDFVEALKEVLPQLNGAFSLAILYDNKIIGARDERGTMPLCIGSSEDTFVLASESCAFYPVNATFLRDVGPGEIVVIGEDRIERSVFWHENPSCRFCMFNFVYFARPDSRLCKGVSAWHYRNKAGEILAEEAPVDADLVISAPSGGDIFAEAFAAKLGIRYKQGLFKTRSGVRTFMAPRHADKRRLQSSKLHALSEALWQKRVCIVDDSLVRGSALPRIVEMVYSAGAIEVHVRIASSPIRFPCYYGIDMPTKDELAAAKYKEEEVAEKMRERVGACSLAYLSLEGMVRATGLAKKDLCLGCFTGDYPVPVPLEQ